MIKKKGQKMIYSWDYVANYIIKEISYVDWEEEFYVCPECDEFVYKKDYPFIQVGMICPICKNEIEE